MEEGKKRFAANRVVQKLKKVIKKARLDRFTSLNFNHVVKIAVFNDLT